VNGEKVLGRIFLMLDATLKRVLMPLLTSGDMPSRRPILNEQLESNVPNLYIVGDLAGAPVVKLAMEQGHQVATHLSKRLQGGRHGHEFDVLVLGAGAAGLNAALTLHQQGFKVAVVEQRELASTIEDFPEGKWIYAEPVQRKKQGDLWLEEARKEELLSQWKRQVESCGLDIRMRHSVKGIRRLTDGLEVSAAAGAGEWKGTARFVILATGQRGTPRRLNVPGDDSCRVSHRLYSPKNYDNEKILVVGGGNSAVEAATALAPQNHVTLSYRGSNFGRVLKDNLRRLAEWQKAGRIEVIFDSEVLAFDADTYRLKTQQGEVLRPYDHAFVLIGADLPTQFLKQLGIRLENEWHGNAAAAFLTTIGALLGLSIFKGQGGAVPLLGLAAALACIAMLVIQGARSCRFSWLGLSFLISHAIYGAKQSPGFELWPYTGWGAQLLAFGGRSWSFWYTVLYTVVMTVFGLQAMKRWGFDQNDKFQILRYISLISFQWIFFFIIPEFLFQVAVQNQWVGQALAGDPLFAQNAWRSYGLIYAWPLFFYTFFDNPHQIWVVWGLFLSFVLIPILAIWHGKRYCSWVCGCGGLAETLGDRWRHLAPKGRTAITWEKMNVLVFVAAVIVTLSVVGSHTYRYLQAPAQFGKEWYHLVADTWLVGILPVTLYPFLGGKVWCRYWCPLAKLMEIFSSLYARLKITHFAIHSNDKCIACGECSRYCQVGIDVMSFATMQKELNNSNSSCIGCGICVTVCPMDVLSFRESDKKLVQIQAAA
jgi:thioredoxin reductase/polyferredoxin